MATAEYWSLTNREFKARLKVRREYMMQWLIETRNAPWFHREDSKPYSSDNLFTASSGGRSEEQILLDKIATMKAQMELSQLASRPELVPAWAKGPWTGPPKRSTEVPRGTIEASNG